MIRAQKDRDLSQVNQSIQKFTVPSIISQLKRWVKLKSIGVSSSTQVAS